MNLPDHANTVTCVVLLINVFMSGMVDDSYLLIARCKKYFYDVSQIKPIIL